MTEPGQVTPTEPRRATLLIVGDELLAGELADANGPFLAEQLAARGLGVVELRVLPDRLEVIAGAVRAALARSYLVILCGGLGPTSDDLTAEAVALALGRSMVFCEPAWERICEMFSSRGREVPASNRKQAMLPEGAQVLHNLWGTAPGFLVRVGAARLAALPGPPRENRPMFTQVLWPLLEEEIDEGSRLQTRVYRVFGLPESEVGERLGPLEESFPEVRVGYQARFPEILVKLRFQESQGSLAEAAAGELSQALGPHLYGEGGASLPEVLGRAAEARGRRIVTAESCTGGLVAKLLTDIPGSTGWLDRGFVTYSNRSKEELLGVGAALLAEHGAVSEPVVRAMAEGALRRSEADLCLAITGVAGPGGGSAAKPVGTVWLAWGDAERIHTRRVRFPFDRALNRRVSAWAAMWGLFRFLDGEPG